MAEDKARSSNAGPIILAALILLGGYIAYDQWRQHDQHSGECATLKRQFGNNMNSMMGPAKSAIEESKRKAISFRCYRLPIEWQKTSVS